MSREIAEWLALGTAHPVDPANVGRSTGPARWEFADAGWALAGLPNHIAWLLRAKYMGDGSDNYSLFVEALGHAFNSTLTLRIGEDLTVADIRGLTKAALIEVLTDGRCDQCGGVAELMIDNKIAKCATCRGLGRVEMSERRLSTLSGLSRRRVGTRDCMQLFKVVASLLSGWESTGLSMVRKRVSRGGTVSHQATAGSEEGGGSAVTA